VSTLVVGDVHGCADELAKLVAIARADRVVLVGDLFTKGPDPVGVWQQIRDGGFEAVLGNHDARILEAVEDPLTPDRGARKAVEKLKSADPAALGWLAAVPLFLEAPPFTVVHAGIHPSGDLALTTRKMAITMRRWPDEKATDPHWHSVYTGARRVIFGHDALRGLVRVERGGQPWLIGLDTGCVYGGALSGYLIDRDEVLSVKAARVYRPISR
jgi:hypothetical protein